MAEITIEITEDFIVVEYCKLAGSRRVWAGPGIDVYVKGKMSASDFEPAQHMAMVVCDEMHIPVGSLRLVDQREKPVKKSALSTDTKRMF